jgi:asparagine synthase (glutamine-hydrolysing)
LCGLNLIIDKKGLLPESAIRRMAAATQHRGPDATAFHTAACGKGRIYFGHNRLKIIDFSDQANQPFCSPDGRYLLIYNGEIYNFRELRQQLRRQGCSFRTDSDTEVILHLLIQKGPTGLAELNGMFALAFYDTRQQLLWLARDRFGIKPLFYADTDEYLVVSSSMQGILAAGLLKKELQTLQLLHYLQYRHAAAPGTFYRHIFSVQEGTAVCWDHGSRTAPALSFSPPAALGPEKPEALVRQTESLLTQSVVGHLVADVPVGLFLSGGIDSTLLLALLYRAGHRHFPAFSITHSPADASFGTDDGHFARLAARQYQAEHTCFEVDDSILQDTDGWVASLDQPIADSAGLLTAYLSRQVKPYIKVALSGAGADELFGGYNRHRAFALYLEHQRLATILKTGLKPVASLLPTGFHHPWRKQFRLFRKLTYKLQHDPGQTFLNFTAMDRTLQLLWHHPLGKPALEKRPRRNKEQWLQWALHHDQHHYLIADVLAVTDQASMQHGLEVRTPYLENHLQQFLSQLPATRLFQGGQKWILKEILARQQGSAFLKRSKEGFGLPLGSWLRKPGNRYLLAELQDRRQPVFEFLRYEATQTLLRHHLNQRQDLSAEIWALIVLAKWLQHNFT